ncbi:hypothetical protein MAR_014763 [Mya arenaria]|uniref:MADF domain-containing protein n=1 Tax=Mya arenaria TaxID=6604 RepID=A0ABY7FHE7_MYAAR|nr:hypothetical protein MAR_014763 [Mya arenaria]
MTEQTFNPPYGGIFGQKVDDSEKKELLTATWNNVHQYKFPSSFNEKCMKRKDTLVMKENEEDSQHPRTAAELTKKWDNLVQTHRAKYSQYKRELGRTGSGTNPVKLSEVTERVMAVVGENSPNIVGLGSGLDSTILQMQSAVETPSQPSHTIE